MANAARQDGPRVGEEQEKARQDEEEVHPAKREVGDVLEPGWPEIGIPRHGVEGNVDMVPDDEANRERA